MIAVVLYQPEIPPNTGNVIRLCANTGAELHLVEPLGFDLTDKALRRAGLDYHEYARVLRHADWQACQTALGQRRLWAMTTRGTASPSIKALRTTTPSSSVRKPAACPLNSSNNFHRNGACVCRCRPASAA